MTISDNKLATQGRILVADDDLSEQDISVDVDDADEMMPSQHSNEWSSFPHPIKHPLRSSFWIVRTLFGIGIIVLLLAIVAAVPILSLLVLGYLLDVEGRVARSGRFRDAFPLLVAAPRIGTIVLGTGLWLLPIFFVSGMASDAAFIDLSGLSAGRWEFARVVLSVLIAVHLCLALARGGSLGCFFRPIKNIRWLISELKNRPVKNKTRCPRCGEAQKMENAHCSLCGMDLAALTEEDASKNLSVENSYWQRANRKIGKFLETLQLKYRFLLGIRGLLGALAILLLPTVLFSVAESTKGFPILVTVFGGLCLAIVFLYVPFLQANLAVKNRLGAMFELKLVRKMFLQTPFTFFFALLAVYALALPLYLFTAFALPRDAMWLLTLVFIASIYPARVVTGWAFHRATKKLHQNRKPAWFGWRWLCRVLMFATTVAYTFFFFFARDIGTHGKMVLFEHHAFLGTVLSSIFSLLP